MDEFKLYEVGGCVRDEILGLVSKDIDYVAVPNDKLLKNVRDVKTMFEILKSCLKKEGFEIFIEHPSCFTIRARFPKDHINHKLVADFVMARKEIGYIEGTRTPIIVPGTLFDDLQRRDFTINALAKDENGDIIDLFEGRKHIEEKVLVTPLDVNITFNDDPLRLLRAIRFSITKGFKLRQDIHSIIHCFDYSNKMKVVSKERIREELLKCFEHDSLLTIKLLNEYKYLSAFIFNKIDGELYLKPTIK